MSFHPLSQASPHSHHWQSGIPLFSFPADPFLFVLPLRPSSWTFQRPTSAPGAGWSPCSLRHRRARRVSCCPPSPLRHCPRPRCPRRTNLTEMRGTRERLPSTPRGRNAAAPPGGSAESCPQSPGGRTEPARRCRGPAAAPSHTSPVQKHPFPRAGHGGRATQPMPSRAPQPRAHLSRERGSVPQPRRQRRPRRPHLRTGPRCPSRGRPSGRVGSGRGDPSGGTRPLPEPRSSGGAPQNGPASVPPLSAGRSGDFVTVPL